MAARLFKALEQSRRAAGSCSSNAAASMAASAAAPLMHLASSRLGLPLGSTPDVPASAATLSGQTGEPAGRSAAREVDRIDFTPLLQDWYGKSFGCAGGAPPSAAGGGGGGALPRGNGVGPSGVPAPGSAAGGRVVGSGTTAALQLLEELSKTTSKLSLAQPERNPDQNRNRNHNQQQLLHGMPFAASNPPWLPPPNSSDSFESPLGSALVSPQKVLGAPQLYPCYGAEASHEAAANGLFSGASMANQLAHPSLGESTHPGSTGADASDGSDATEEQEAPCHGYYYQQQAGVVYPNQMAAGSGSVQEPLSEKKLRRLLSNRASAKRSRKRRQDRLQELEIVSARLHVEQAQVQHSLATAQAEVRKFQAENEELKKEVQRLRAAAGVPSAGLFEGGRTRSRDGSGKHSCSSPTGAASVAEGTETSQHPGEDTCPPLNVEREEGVPPKKRCKPDAACHASAETPMPLPQSTSRGQKVCDLNEFLVYIGCEEMVHAS